MRNLSGNLFYARAFEIVHDKKELERLLRLQLKNQMKNSVAKNFKRNSHKNDNLNAF